MFDSGCFINLACVLHAGWFGSDLRWRELSDRRWNSDIFRKKPVLLQQPPSVPTAPEREIHQLLPRHGAEPAGHWRVVCHHQRRLTALITCSSGGNTETTAAMSLEKILSILFSFLKYLWFVLSGTSSSILHFYTFLGHVLTCICSFWPSLAICCWSSVGDLG